MANDASSLARDPGSLVLLARAIAAHRTDPAALIDACLARIDAVEAHVQGWCSVDRNGAHAQAERLRDAAARGRIFGPLHGVPVAIKDVVDVAGWPTQAGSRTRANAPAATIDAAIVTALKSAGAIVLGKAHTTEFAYFHGPPPTRNPHDRARTPGGSSAGPAAVVAAGMVPLSVGTQTAGSVSRPAAYCGIAAYKPSTLSWSSSGLLPFAPSFDTPGLFAHRVSDVALAARALMPAHLVRANAPIGVRLRIGFVEDPILAAAASSVHASMQTALEKLAHAGHALERVASPVPLAGVGACHKTMIEHELARVHPQLASAPEEDVTPALREAVLRGRAIDASTYLDARRAIDAERTRFWSALAAYDAIMFPAAPDVAPVGMKTGDPRFIVPFTALGGPMISVPIALVAGLPLGAMLMGAPGSDTRRLDIAERLAASIELAR